MTTSKFTAVHVDGYGLRGNSPLFNDSAATIIARNHSAANAKGYAFFKFAVSGIEPGATIDAAAIRLTGQNGSNSLGGGSDIKISVQDDITDFTISNTATTRPVYFLETSVTLTSDGVNDYVYFDDSYSTYTDGTGPVTGGASVGSSADFWSPDIGSLLQDLVDDPSWTTGTHYITIWIWGQTTASAGVFTVYSSENVSGEPDPYLYIDHTSPISPDSIGSAEDVPSLAWINTLEGSYSTTTPDYYDATQNGIGAVSDNDFTLRCNASTTAGSEDYFQVKIPTIPWAETLTGFTYRSNMQTAGTTTIDGNLAVVKTGLGTITDGVVDGISDLYDAFIVGGGTPVAWTVTAAKGSTAETPDLSDLANDILQDVGYDPLTDTLSIIFKGSNSVDEVASLYNATNGSGYVPKPLFDWAPLHRVKAVDSVSSSESVGSPEITFFDTGILRDLGDRSGVYASPVLNGNLGWDVSSVATSSNQIDKLMDKDFASPSATSYFKTDNTANSWFSLDFGVAVQVDAYTIMPSNEGYLLRNWKLQGSSDNSIWTDVDIRISDSEIATTSDLGHFVCSESGDVGYYRYYRLLQDGLNADADNVLAIEQIEFNGDHPGFSGITLDTLPENYVAKQSTLADYTDTGGIFYGLGTEFGASSWSNPVDNVEVSYSQSSVFSGRTLNQVSDHASATWTSGSGNSHWGKWDFGTTNEVNVKGIALNSHATLNEALQNFVVEGSDNDSDWTTLVTVGTRDPLVTTEVFYWADDIEDTTTWRYLRYTVTMSSSRARITELDFYGFVGEPTAVVSPDSVSSGEDVSNVTITAGAVTVSPDSVTSDEDVSEPTVTLDAAPISVDSVTSDEDVSEPTVTAGAVTLSPDSVTSDEDVNNVTITVGAVTISPDSVSSDEDVNDVIITTGPVTVSPDSVLTDEDVNNPTVQVGAVTISVDSVVSLEDVSDPTTVATITVNVDGVTSEEVVADPTVVYDQIVEALSVSSAEDVSSVNVVYVISVDGILTGEVVSSISGADLASNPTTVLQVLVGVTTEIVATTVKRTTISVPDYTATRTD